jgi:hypothetical protein
MFCGFACLCINFLFWRKRVVKFVLLTNQPKQSKPIPFQTLTNKNRLNELWMHNSLVVGLGKQSILYKKKNKNNAQPTRHTARKRKEILTVSIVRFNDSWNFLVLKVTAYDPKKFSIRPCWFFFSLNFCSFPIRR